ncbi:MAG TPA: hypothetical protein PLY23_00325 [Alphaproteobacteria bacterium]|nr:hypothetical protein [Alphaproteobacteria bacterium]HQS93034.1 hypothetical protein [Alphaproteobacteria bacterium]
MVKETALLSIFAVFDNNKAAYFVMALTILAACPSISPSSELKEKLATCSYRLSSLWGSLHTTKPGFSELLVIESSKHH